MNQVALPSWPYDHNVCNTVESVKWNLKVFFGTKVKKCGEH